MQTKADDNSAAVKPRAARTPGSTSSSLKPIRVRAGSTTVSIYPVRNRGAVLYTLTYYKDGKRVRKNFANREKAKQEAHFVAAKLQSAEGEALTLKSEDRFSYVEALNTVRPTGKPLHVAVAEYAAASKILGGRPLVEAARFYANHFPSELPKKTVSEVVAEMLAAKQADGASHDYVKDMRHRFRVFEKQFNGNIASITTPQLDDWLRSLKVSGRSRNNYRRAVITFFHFARYRGYLPKGLPTAADDLSEAKEQASEIGIFKPEEMEQLLCGASDDIIPFLAIGAFAGVRHAELLRLDWADVNLDERFIEIKAAKAKTASRRIIPMEPNLVAWLSRHHKSQGPVCSNARIGRKVKQLADRLKIRWPSNGLRHSFGSYRLATCKSAAQVALEMGNSPQMVFNHYRELVTARAAEKWWAIAPT